MTNLGEARTKFIDLVQKVKDKTLSKREAHVSSDPHVASSRVAKDAGDGSYVGRTGPDVALDVEQSGAEARSEQNRNSP